MIEFIDKTSEQSGTPLNRKNLMAIQGFGNNNVEIVENDDGSVVVIENNGDEQVLTTRIVENDDGTIQVVQLFVGEKTITKTVFINEEGTQISEVIS